MNKIKAANATHNSTSYTKQQENTFVVIVNWKYQITFDTLGQNKGVHSIFKIQGRTIHSKQ
jgi:hypothetical protein